jgi:hypothetical protein
MMICYKKKKAVAFHFFLLVPMSFKKPQQKHNDKKELVSNMSLMKLVSNKLLMKLATILKVTINQDVIT